MRALPAPMRPSSASKNRHNAESAAPIVGYTVAVQDMLGGLVDVHHTAFPLEAARVARAYAEACAGNVQAVLAFPVRSGGPPGIQRFPLPEWGAMPP